MVSTMQDATDMMLIMMCLIDESDIEIKQSTTAAVSAGDGRRLPARSVWGRLLMLPKEFYHTEMTR